MATVSDVTTVTYSGDLRVDSLLYSTVDWNFLLVARTTLFYTFDLSVISTVSGTPVTAFNAAQKAAAISILNYASGVTGIVFAETPSGAAADFHFGSTNIAGASTSGETHTSENYSFTGSNVLTSYSAEAFIFLDNVEFLANNSNPVSGTVGYEVLLHEVGHALGLGHPFDGTFQLPMAQDNTNNTVMSYTHVGGIKTTFQAYDLLALRWIYGEDGLRGSFGFNSTNGPSLTLVPPGDTTAPTVSSFSPADEASNVAVGSNIVLTFSEAIARGTGFILLKNGLGTTIETYNAANSTNLSISANTLTIDPTLLLANGTAYSLEFGAGNIKDLAGNAYAGVSNYNFTTIAAVSHPPTAIISDNVPGTANLSTSNIAYLLSFSEDVIGLELSDFTVINGTANSLTGSAKLWTINVTPAPNISNGVVELTLKSGAVSNLSGDLNARIFNASQAIDTVAPLALNFNPADEASNITTDSNIVLTFSEAIQRGSASIILKNAAGTVIESFDVGTSNRVSISGSTLTINPSADLLDSSEYRLEFVSASVKDLAGNAYAGSSNYNFSTAIPIIMTGTPGNDNFIGDNGNDRLSGAAGNDTFKGNGGNDMIDGGIGLDLARYNGKITDYTLSQNGANIVVQANSGTDGKDTLQNIERLQFSDNNIAFDILGNAGQAYRLYQAAFDRKPDLAGLGYWINDMDNGSSLTNVAGGFFQSPEFQTLYGSNPNTTTLITNFYKNVLHRAPDQAGFDYWANELNNHIITPAGALASFCESTENQAQVIGSIQNGIAYSPWLV